MSKRTSQLDRSRFFGRRELLDQLAELAGTGTHCGLVGPSGSGKSRLAREYARRDPDAHYIDAATEGFVTPESLQGASILFVDGDPTLLDLDTFSGQSTSICRCDGAWGDVTLEVGPLGRDAALDLLVDRVRAGDANFEVSSQTSDAVHELLDLSGGWPLVIEQLARRLVLFTPGELVEQCREGAVPWQGLPGNQAWAKELDRLGEPEWQVLAVALALPAGFDLRLIREIATLSSNELLDAIEGLQQALILRRVDERGAPAARFVVDQTAHAAATTRTSRRNSGHEMVMAFWQALAVRMWEQMSIDGGADVEQLFRDEEWNATHMFEAERRRNPELAALLGSAIYHSSRGGWPVEKQESWRESLNRLRDAATGRARLAASTALANGRRTTRQFNEAVELLEHEASTDDGIGVQSRLELGRCLNLVDRFAAAREQFTSVRDDAPRAYLAARADAHLGVALHNSTNLEFQAARDELVVAMALSREIEADRTLERSRQAQISVTLAQGDFETARVHAAAICDELSDSTDPRRMAGAHLQLADILIEMGLVEEAVARIEAAEEILEGYDFARLAGYGHFSRSKIALLEGDADRALRHVAKASELFGEEPAAFLLDLIGEVARAMGSSGEIRADRHEALAEAAWAYWPPVGASAELMFLACRRVAGAALDDDDERLAKVRARSEETGMAARLSAAKLLAGEDVEPRGFDGLVIARLVGSDGSRRLRVGPEGRWFAVGRAEPVDISGRKALPELLEALVDAAGDSLDPYQLAEAGWPSEELHPETAKNRVYVAVHALRKMGLAEVLRTEGGGYALEHGVIVERMD